jgi:hypothetical protein
MFRWLHIVGASLILISAILLLVTTISAPVIGDIGIMKVMLKNQTDIRHGSLTFGTFGHCALDVPPITTDQDYCSPKTIGYKIADIMSQVDGTSFNLASTDSTNGLTNAFILHPIACGLAFIAAIFAFGGFFGSIVGILIALLAWIITFVVMVIDFVVFGVSLHNPNTQALHFKSHFSRTHALTQPFPRSSRTTSTKTAAARTHTTASACGLVLRP